MNFRIATSADIAQLQKVRNSVRENMLSDPMLVSDVDVEEYITKRGKGWVCEINETIVGFAIADLQDKNIWALFIDPEYEKRGIGRKLQLLMLDWYFLQKNTFVWLSTSPNTRAAAFYKRSGWREVGVHGKGEIKFEMTENEWAKIRENDKR